MPNIKQDRAFFLFFLSFFGLIFLLSSVLNRASASFYSTTIIPSAYANPGTPRDLITLPNGDMWYADSQNSRIVKINSAGAVLRTVGRAGNNDGEFAWTLTSMTRDDQGFLYVIDYHQIYKFDFNGGFIKKWGVFGNGVGELANPENIHYSAHGDMLIVSNSVNNRITKFDTDGNFISEFGTGGTSNGEFNEPHGLTTDIDGNIYVVDTNNHRVQVFQEDGTFIRTFGDNNPGDYQFIFPKDVEVLSNGDIVVTSQNAPLIKKFTNAGVYISAWGVDGTGDNQFKAPEFLTKAADDSIWVTDWNQKRLQHFSKDGVFIGVFGNSGDTAGKFINPYALDFDVSGNIYVLDATGRVQKFNASGTYISTPIAAGTLGEGAYHIAVSKVTGNIFVSSTYAVSVFDSAGVLINNVGNRGLWEDPPNNGTGPGEFNNARGMALDSADNLYVVDYSNSRVQKFDISQIANGVGGYVAQWPVMLNPENIFIDEDDNVYVSPPEHNGSSLNVQKFTTAGVFQSIYLDKFGTDPDQYYKIGGMHIDGVGKFYLSDRYYNRIQIYNSSGTWIESVGSSGSEQDQFDNVNYAKINPVGSDLVAVDTNNHRLQIFANGVKIKNLITSADVINTNNSLSLVRKTTDPLAPDADSLEAELHFGDYVVSDFNVDLSVDRDWSDVNAIILPDESRSLVVNLNPTDAPGISATHSLFIVQQPGQNSVVVCPDAATIADVNLSCINGYTLEVGDPSLSSVNIDGIDYWKVTGLTGTGAMGDTVSVSPTPTPTVTPTSAPTPTPTEESALGRLIASADFSSNNGSSGDCSSVPVVGSPDLFQIDVNGSTARLFFTPLSNTSDYYISFSTKPSTEEHAEKITLMREGVQSHKVFYLKANTTYYFKIRGQNGCMNGNWSNVMRITTRAKNVTKWTSFYKNILVKKVASLTNSKKTSKAQDVAVVSITPTAPAVSARPVISNEIPTTSSQAPIKPAQKKWCFLKWCF